MFIIYYTLFYFTNKRQYTFTMVEQNFNRVYNFSAGPCCLPEEVLLSVQKDMMNYQGKGLSVMEMSHRSKNFTDISEQCERSLR